MFKGLSNIAALMSQAKNIGGQMEGVTDELKNKQVLGVAGGGMVHVHANGLGHITKIEIDETLQAKNDIEMVLDLLPAAINDAVGKSRALHVESMQSLTEGISLPGGLEDAFKQFTGQYAASPTENESTDNDDSSPTDPPAAGNQG